MTVTQLMTKGQTMRNKKRNNKKTPDQIVQKFRDDNYCLELLRFFGNYPTTRFSELAVVHALSDEEKSRVKGALGRLLLSGIVGVCIANGTHLYKLADNEGFRDAVMYLAKLEWREWRMIIGNNTGVHN